MNPYMYMRHLLVGPLTLLMYIWFAFGMTVYNYYQGHSFQKVWYYAFGVPFAIADILYNLTVGSFIFWEKPRLDELMFTCRITRLMKEGNPLATTFCRMLDVYDEGHCKC